MKVTFEGPAVMVRDMGRSRAFYEELLGHGPQFTVGEAYAHFGNFSLWSQQGALDMIHGPGTEGPEDVSGAGVFELYFETDDLDQAWDRLAQAGARAAHPIREQPWGQRCFRVLDPEGRLVELAEPMALVVRRFLGQGLTPEEASRRTMLPLAVVEAMASAD